MLNEDDKIKRNNMTLAWALGVTALLIAMWPIYMLFNSGS